MCAYLYLCIQHMYIYVCMYTWIYIPWFFPKLAILLIFPVIFRQLGASFSCFHGQIKMLWPATERFWEAVPRLVDFDFSPAFRPKLPYPMMGSEPLIPVPSVGPALGYWVKEGWDGCSFSLSVAKIHSPWPCDRVFGYCRHCMYLKLDDDSKNGLRKDKQCFQTVLQALYSFQISLKWAQPRTMNTGSRRVEIGCSFSFRMRC